MESEIGQLRSRRTTMSTHQSLEDRMDSALKISPNLTPEFDDDHHHREYDGKVSDFDFPQGVYKDGGNKTNEDLTDKKKKEEKTSVSTPPCQIAQDDETAKISSLLPSLGQLDATADDNDGFKTPTDEAHMIPPLTECPPAPKIKKRTCYDSTVNSASVRPRRCRRKLMFDGFDLTARLKIQEDEDKGISAP